MKSTRQIFINLLFIIFVISLLIACNKIDNTIHNNWQTIYQNDGLDLQSIKFLDKDHGFVLADSSGIHGLLNWKFVLSTQDGGNTWNPITCTTYDTVDQFPLYDIDYMYPISQNILLTTGYRVHKSTDAGKTWKDVSPQSWGPVIYDLHIIDSITWVVAKGNNIYRTNNAGQTWQIVSDKLPPSGHFSFPSLSTGYAYGGYFNCGISGIGPCVNYGNVAKTIDAGQSWTILEPEPWKSNNISIPNINALQFITDQTGYMSTFGDYKLYKTVDGGNNWVLIHNDNNANGLEYFISENLGYYSDGETIYVTNDGGKTWKADYYNNAVESDILAWTFLETGEGYAITKDHRIIKNIH